MKTMFNLVIATALVLAAFGSARASEESPVPESPVYYTESVPAHFTDNWRLDAGAGWKAIAFNGRASLRLGRGAEGGDLPPGSEVKLRGELVAEEDGEAAIGVGADWWWTCSVNGREITGRLPSMPEGNLKTTFEATDWIFLVPVHGGTNTVELSVLLGESGLVAVGTAPPERVADGLSLDLEKAYRFYKENFPDPETVPFRPSVSWNGMVRFRTAKPFPAGVEYRLGKGEWHVVWDKRPSRRHSVRIPVSAWHTCHFRPVQRIFRGGWQTIRGEAMEWPR